MAHSGRNPVALATHQYRLNPRQGGAGLPISRAREKNIRFYEERG